MSSGDMHVRDETEPLLGEPGDVTQKSLDGFQWNILTGTAAIAQGGIWVLTAIVWSAVFEHNLMYFSIHPLANAAGLLLLVQAILVLQPTATQKQKIRGAYIHSIFQTLGLGAFLAGLIVIVRNKGSKPHFTSLHGRLGLAMYIFFYLNYVVGVVQFYFPSLLGGVDKGKALYKYHRVSGYLMLALGLIAIVSAVTTGYNQSVLGLKAWSMITTAVLVVIGIVPRIKLSKLGF